MIILFHHIRERPLVLFGNHACPLPAIRSPMNFRDCYQDGMLITSETGWCRNHSVLLHHFTSAETEPKSFSLLTPPHSSLGPKRFRSLYVLFFASEVQYLTVIEKIVVTLLLSNFHFPSSSRDCWWVCASLSPQCGIFFTWFMQMLHKRKLTLLSLNQFFVMSYAPFFKYNTWVCLKHLWITYECIFMLNKFH